jgi:hypothetical protein
MQRAATAQARNDYRELRAIAKDVRARSYPSSVLSIANAFLDMLDWSAGAAEIRANWPLLIALAGQRSDGYPLIAAAQADLNRADGEARAAEIVLESAVRQFRTSCAA